MNGKLQTQKAKIEAGICRIRDFHGVVIKLSSFICTIHLDDKTTRGYKTLNSIKKLQNKNVYKTPGKDLFVDFCRPSI